MNFEVTRKECTIVKNMLRSYERKRAIAQDYVRIYRNRKLSARNPKRKALYYRKQKAYENRIIKLTRLIQIERRNTMICKRAGYL